MHLVNFRDPRPDGFRDQPTKMSRKLKGLRDFLVRQVLGGAGNDDVTLHMLRCTVATAVNDNASIELAAELLGRTDTRVRGMQCIQWSELVKPATAALPIGRSRRTETERGAATVPPRWRHRV